MSLLEQLRTWCDGSESCEALEHYHGCGADDGFCDEQNEHPSLAWEDQV
jgi:hypothetical protein